MAMRSPGSAIFVPLDGIDALHGELTAKKFPYAKPGIDEMPWGRVMEIADPFGNGIRFCESKP
jgi:hypothetical protein